MEQKTILKINEICLSSYNTSKTSVPIHSLFHPKQIDTLRGMPSSSITLVLDNGYVQTELILNAGFFEGEIEKLIKKIQKKSCSLIVVEND